MKQKLKIDGLKVISLVTSRGLGDADTIKGGAETHGSCAGPTMHNQCWSWWRTCGHSCGLTCNGPC